MKIYIEKKFNWEGKIVLRTNNIFFSLRYKCCSYLFIVVISNYCNHYGKLLSLQIGQLGNTYMVAENETYFPFGD